MVVRGQARGGAELLLGFVEPAAGEGDVAEAVLGFHPVGMELDQALAEVPESSLIGLGEVMSGPPEIPEPYARE